VKILVIGESCKDVYQYGDCVRLCPEAPVPVFQSNKSRRANAGMAMNVYNNMNSLSEAEIEISTNKNWEETIKTRYVDFRTNSIVLRIDINDITIQRCDLNKIDFEQYDAVVISDYNKGFVTEADIEDISNQHSVTFLDTKKILGSWCQNIKFIKINEFEYDRTKHRLTDELVSKMIITLGPNGAKFNDKVYQVPKVEIKDTSGAGDTFIAGLVSKYVETGDIDISIAFANDCATRVVQKKGVSIA
jgi:bifunctional ADP-heptose synthase (sugar kinase/adenylyltransferase)